jgi:hypothetical protein
MWWCAKWRSTNRLDGKTEHLIIGRYWLSVEERTQLFMTRKECRNWISKHYGYIKDRRDLREEPHGWRVPIAVKVRVNEL